MDNISFDSFYEIVSKLENNEIASLCLVNKKFQEYCNNDQFWQRLVEKKYGKVEQLGSWYTTYRHLNAPIYIVSVLIPSGKHTIFDSKPFRDEASAINYLIAHDIFKCMIVYELPLQNYGFSGVFEEACGNHQYDITQLEDLIKEIDASIYDYCYNAIEQQRIKEDFAKYKIAIHHIAFEYLKANPKGSLDDGMMYSIKKTKLG